MSRAWAAVHFPDGEVKYAAYDGVSDHLLPRLFAGLREALPAYYSGAELSRPDSVRSGSGEPVTIYCDYGDGSLWQGTATREYVTSECNWLKVDGVVDCNWSKPEWLQHAGLAAKRET